MGAELYWFLPVRLLARIKYDTLRRLPDIHCPLLIVHGKSDRIVPFPHGRRLFDAANQPKDFLEIPAGHNEAHTTTRYQDALRQYLDKHFPHEPASQAATRKSE